MSKELLSEDALEQVQGGNIDWELFSKRFLQELSNFKSEVKKEYLDLIDAIKKKDWIEVGIIALPLIAQGDQLLMKIFLEVKDTNV